MFEKIMRAFRPAAPEVHAADAPPNDEYYRQGVRLACRDERFIARDVKRRWLEKARQERESLEAQLRAAEIRP